MFIALTWLSTPLSTSFAANYLELMRAAVSIVTGSSAVEGTFFSNLESKLLVMMKGNATRSRGVFQRDRKNN